MYLFSNERANIGKLSAKKKETFPSAEDYCLSRYAAASGDLKSWTLQLPSTKEGTGFLEVNETPDTGTGAEVNETPDTGIGAETMH